MDHVKELRKKGTRSNAFEASRDVCAVLQTMGEVHSVHCGAMLFCKGDPPKGVFLVLKGRVALSAGDDPCRITRIAGKDSLLGLPSTVGNRRYSLSAEAVTETQVCHISPAQFRRSLAADPVLGFAVVRILSEEVSALRRLAVYKL